jgi:hypothetical protein
MLDAGSSNRPRGIVGRLSARAKSALRWLAFSVVDDRKFQLLLAIASAINVHRRTTEVHVEFEQFRTLLKHTGRSFSLLSDDILPCVSDRLAETPFDPHYTYYPAWAARVLARTRPAKHVDISSILSFAAIVSAFIAVEFYDFRPAPLRLSNFSGATADLTRLGFSDNSVASLSSMHVIEHIGLGRYGEPLDPMMI